MGVQQWQRPGRALLLLCHTRRGAACGRMLVRLAVCWKPQRCWLKARASSPAVGGGHQVDFCPFFQIGEVVCNEERQGECAREGRQAAGQLQQRAAQAAARWRTTFASAQAAAGTLPRPQLAIPAHPAPPVSPTALTALAVVPPWEPRNLPLSSLTFQLTPATPLPLAPTAPIVPATCLQVEWPRAEGQAPRCCSRAQRHRMEGSPHSRAVIVTRAIKH